MSGAVALYDCRKAFAEALEAAAAADDRIVAVINDSLGSSNIGGFKKKFPGRVVNVGIAEQNMVGVGCGLATAGMVPFVCGASCFLTGRAAEQVKVDLGYSKANVKLCGMSSGLAYGPLGATHHSIEDLAWTRAIPNLTVIVPADPDETAQAVRAALDYQGPVFLRLSRMGVPAIHPNGYQFQIGKAVRLREGAHVSLIANGTMVSRAIEAAALLAARGIESRVVNMATLKPLDEAEVLSAARDTGAVVTVEEATINGGLGGAVCELLSSECPVPVKRVGVPDQFAPTGSLDFLFEHFGLTAAGIARAAESALAMKVQRL